MRNLLFATLLFASLSAFAQTDYRPTLKEVIMQPIQEQPKVLGLFKNETQASAWLGVGGLVSVFTGSYLQGKAAHHIQVHGHSSNGDNYEITRTSGLTLQVMGGAAYGAGFAYRSKKWYKKHPVIFGLGEAAVLMVANHYVSRFAYNQL